MFLRLNPFRVVFNVVVLAGGLTIGPAAYAQLGSVNNPPPQNLFNFKDNPKPLNDGLGTMAERRRTLAKAKVRRRPVHHTQK